MFFFSSLRKCRQNRIIFLLVFIITVSFCFLLYYNNEIDDELLKTRKHIPRMASLPFDVSAAANGVVSKSGNNGSQFSVVHLDLKGAPPKIAYLRALFPAIAAAGANALLLEYEDMFPYDGPIRNITALNAYTKKQIKELLSIAKESKLEVIPLVQTFGHLEFALKLEEFKYLRELNAFPQEVCPSNPDSLSVLIFEMIGQMMDAHPDARYLHIGCDEVYHLAACARCARRRVDSSKDSRMLFTDHVTKVANHVRDVYHVTPLVWDDMFRQWSPMDLAESGLGGLVEPVVWVYIADITSLVPHYVWHMYGGLFPDVWVAGAFKGAFGETNVIPDIGRHLDNQLAWMRLIRAKTPLPVNNFRGIILTGWARYDHFAVLCELLPSALPSLLLNLLVVNRAFGAQRGTDAIGAQRAVLTSREDERQLLGEVYEEWKTKLSCPPSFAIKTVRPFAGDPHMWGLKSCSFPGSNLFLSIFNFVVLKSEVETMKHKLTVLKGWMTGYNLKHNFSSPFRVLEVYSAVGESGQMLGKQVENFKEEIAGVLYQYFDEFTVKEWIEQKVEPLVESMKYLETSAKGLMARNVWPRRPLL